MKISVITVTYNSNFFLEDYFSSIENQEIDELEIIVVDNGSTDGTIKELKKQKTEKQKNNLIIIDNKKNFGFAKANNIGTKKANGEYLFFLNPDTKLGKDCLKNLLNKAKQLSRKDFILIPRQKSYGSGEFISDGTCVDIFGYPYKIFHAEKLLLTKKPFYGDGASLFIPKEIFLKLGEFDEDLFMFNEEVDLAWKAHLLTIPLVNVSQAVVFHYSGGSLPGGIRKEKVYTTSYLRRYLGERNALRNLFKNYSLLSLLWILPLYLLINLAEIIVFLLAGKPRASFQYIKAWVWNIKNFKSMLKKRNFIQKARKIGDLMILKKLYFGSGKLNAFLNIKIPKFE